MRKKEGNMGNRRLLDQVRDKIRLKHYSVRTEDAYISWIKNYIIFNHKKHPSEMGATEITKYLTWLAIKKNVAASTQNQALKAIVFLYSRFSIRKLEIFQVQSGLKNPFLFLLFYHISKLKNLIFYKWNMAGYAWIAL